MVDLNQDDKLDIIGWAYLLEALRWWENTGSDFSKWVMHPIDNLLTKSCVGEAKYIDLDGDLDVVSTSYANLVVWYENHPSGRMDTYLNYSGGTINTRIFLPADYNESTNYELLIALPGIGDQKLNSSFREAVMKSTFSGVFPVKGAIAVNPEIQNFNPSDWTGRNSPVAIATCTSDPPYPNVEAFSDRLWQDGKKIRLFPFNGPGSDYLTNDLADLTIRRLNYIDSANLLNYREDMSTNAMNQFSVTINGSGTNSKIGIQAKPGEHLYVSLIDLDGRILYPIYQGPMVDQKMELPLYSNTLSLKSGIYLLSVSGSQSGNTGIRVLINSI